MSPESYEGTIEAVSCAPHDGTCVWVLRADQRIKVSGPMMREIDSGQLFVVKPSAGDDGERFFTITARNGCWVYLVDSYDRERDLYYCSQLVSSGGPNRGTSQPPQ